MATVPGLKSKVLKKRCVSRIDRNVVRRFKRIRIISSARSRLANSDPHSDYHLNGDSESCSNESSNQQSAVSRSSTDVFGRPRTSSTVFDKQSSTNSDLQSTRQTVREGDAVTTRSNSMLLPSDQDVRSKPMERSTMDFDKSQDDDYSSYCSSYKGAGYLYENGRRYLKWEGEALLFPDDEIAQDGLDLQNHLFKAVLGTLHLSPVYLRTVLESGSGTGIWSMEMGDEYPEAKVRGLDVDKIAPQWVPPNVTFMIADVRDEYFGSIRYDWPSYVKSTVRHLAGGGQAEFQERDFLPVSHDKLVETPSLNKWKAGFQKANSLVGTDYCPSSKLQKMVEEAGCLEVTSEIRSVPLGTWAKARNL
ncbi:MAG: hypothetical protein Q9227_006114 [Pyrenula ochraceoflavens]